jgi:uncharacterized protein (DUF362 family)
MILSDHSQRHGFTRRRFLAGLGAGLAAGVPLGWLAVKQFDKLKRIDSDFGSFTGISKEDPNPKFAMPGPYPGRVIEVRHPGSVKADNTVEPTAVQKMMARGMKELTGADHPAEAWRRFFEAGDVVGIKVNPVGLRHRPEAVPVISNPEVVIEIVKGLKSAGVKSKDIIVFERYAAEFRDVYKPLMFERELQGVRWYASSADGGENQCDIEGLEGRDRDPMVVGYDPDVFVHMGFAGPTQDPKDDRRFRSHLSVIITRLVNKFINVPVLKDHRSGGVTLALKNLSHGLNNNVWRTHISGIYRLDGSQSGPNQCNTFIPTAASHLAIRQKATLHIMDGLIGVYEGGPGSWNRTWATWPRQSLFFATDPVAMDHVGWDIIDTKRAEMGWRPVAQMGLASSTPAMTLSTRLAALAAHSPCEALPLEAGTEYFEGGRGTEVFDRRQPEHIILASMIGLGVFDARQIDHRRIGLTA